MIDPYKLGPFEPLHIDMVNRMIGTVESGWCQTHLAMDDDNNPVRFSDPRAVKCCLLGAAFKAEWSHFGNTVCLDRNPVYELLRVLAGIRMGGWDHRYIPNRVIEIWNDQEGRKKEDVLELLAEALVIVKGNQRALPAQIVDILSNAKSVEVLEPV